MNTIEKDLKDLYRLKDEAIHIPEPRRKAQKKAGLSGSDESWFRLILVASLALVLSLPLALEYRPQPEPVDAQAFLDLPAVRELGEITRSLLAHIEKE